jgi:hypothetical protein
MEEELAELRRRLEEAEARAAEAQRRREGAETQWRSKTLFEYLEACHEISHDLHVITDKSSTTTGSTTDPTGRQHPKRIVPWHGFIRQQEDIWEQLTPTFRSCAAFPSSHQLDYVREHLRPVSAESGLRYFACDTVENAVRTLIDEAYKDAQLRDTLGLQGRVVFESHTTIGQQSETSILEEMEHLSIAGRGPSSWVPGRSTREGGNAEKVREKGKQDSSLIGVRRRAGLADQFCIYELSDGTKTITTAAEFKPPQKLPLKSIIAGLHGEIRPVEEVINKYSESFEFLSKRLVTAVIAQLFSDMIRKGIPWGYVYTGEAIIFLHIPDDPSVVYYHLSVPKVDYQQGGENRLYGTAVAQVFAFVLRAIRAEPPSASWHDEANTLPTWPVERIGVLSQIPSMAEKKVYKSSYKSRPMKGFLRSPIATRTRGASAACKQSTMDTNVDGDGDIDTEGGNEAPATPTVPQRNRSAIPKTEMTSAHGGRANVGASRRNADGPKQVEAILKPRIEERPYCTHRCLFGLAFGGAMDERCPNFQDHKQRHIDKETFLRLIRRQIATDRGKDADCKILYMKGSRGALFKVRLSSYGYTLVAKGMENGNLGYLEHERHIYDRVRPIQGKHVPVCLGSTTLKRPLYYDGGVYFGMLFLSWAGNPLSRYLGQGNETEFLDKTICGLQALHSLSVLQKDPALRNILWDEQSKQLMIIDFERAEVLARKPLASIAVNRKREPGEGKQMMAKYDFNAELKLAQSYISECVSQQICYG